MIKLVQYTIKDLEDGTSMTYLHRKQRMDALNEPRILRAFASTLIFQVQSSKFMENHTYWHVYLLFEDFKTIMLRDRISLKEAVERAVENLDVHCACTCPAYTYWAHKYYGTQLDYTYGPYRTNMAPTRNNTEMKSLICKHQSKVFEWVHSHKAEIVEAFSGYYEGLQYKENPTDYRASEEAERKEAEKKPKSEPEHKAAPKEQPKPQSRPQPRREDTTTPVSVTKGEDTYVSLTPEAVTQDQFNQFEDEEIEENDETVEEEEQTDESIMEEDDGNTGPDELQSDS